MKWLRQEDLVKISPVYSATSSAMASLFLIGIQSQVSYSVFIFVLKLVTRINIGRTHVFTKDKKICLKFRMYMVRGDTINHSTKCYLQTEGKRKLFSYSARVPFSCNRHQEYILFFLWKGGLGVLYSYCASSAQNWSAVV